MPLLVHSVLRPLGVHRQTVQHARLPDREVGDVDHLLHLAEAFREDLAVLQGHKGTQIALMAAQLFSQQPHRLAALRRGHLAPGGGGRERRGNDILIVGRICGTHLGEEGAVGRIADVQKGAVLRVGPAVRAGPGPGADRIQSQPHENRVQVDGAHRAVTFCWRRWRPVLPVTTTSPEISFVPPGA